MSSNLIGCIFSSSVSFSFSTLSHSMFLRSFFTPFLTLFSPSSLFSYTPSFSYPSFSNLSLFDSSSTFFSSKRTKKKRKQSLDLLFFRHFPITLPIYHLLFFFYLFSKIANFNFSTFQLCYIFALTWRFLIFLTWLHLFLCPIDKFFLDYYTTLLFHSLSSHPWIDKNHVENHSESKRIPIIFTFNML